MAKRNTRPTPSPVSGDYSVTIPSVTVFFSPKEEPDGTFAQVPFDVNEAGQKAYSIDGRNNAYYDDGDVPAGYVLLLKDDKDSPNMKTFDFKVNGQLTLNESTADGGTASEVVVGVKELSKGVKIALRNALKGVADEVAEIKPPAV